MKMSMKKGVALLLSAVLLLTMAPLQVGAEEPITASEESTAEATQPEGAEATQPEGAEGAQSEGEASTQPIVAIAPAPGAVADYNKPVTFVGQWTGESTQKVDTVKNFTAATDKLGEPVANPGLLRSLAKVFLGWSDKAPTGNGQLAEGARLFGKEDSIGKVFPNGIPEDAKIYGVYYSLNAPDRPFSNWDVFDLMSTAEKMSDLINDNKVIINKGVSGEETLPNTSIAEETDEGDTKKIVDYYNKKDDVNSVHEVVLNSEFEMNDTIAMLTYRNPVGSNAIRPILSFDYNNRYAEGGEFGTGDGAAAGYTYVDLEVNLDGEVMVPENLFLEFSGHSWRPLYVFGENKEVLSVLNPVDGTNLGNDKMSFSSLVKNNSPAVTFGVETKGNKKLTLRMVLREGESEKIAEGNVMTTEGQSIPEAILKNMTLKALSKAELKVLQPGLEEAEYNKRILTIKDEVAKRLAETGATAALNISGKVSGHVVAWAGGVALPFLGYTELKSEAEIKASESNKLAISYVERRVNVVYTFVSGTEGKELPEEVIMKKPENLSNILSGTEIALGNYEEVKVEGGTWKFKMWSMNENGTMVPVQGMATVGEADLSLVGEWVFEAEQVKEPEKQPEAPQKEMKKVVKKVQKSAPKTGDNTQVVLYVGMALFSFLVGLGVLLSKKRRQKEV